MSKLTFVVHQDGGEDGRTIVIPARRDFLTIYTAPPTFINPWNAEGKAWECGESGYRYTYPPTPARRLRGAGRSGKRRARRGARRRGQRRK